MDRVHGVAAFVKQGAHIAVHSHGVGENKGNAGLFQIGLIAARGLALAGFQIQKSQFFHGVEVLTELRVYLGQYLFATFDQLFGFIERFQWSQTIGADRHVPRLKGGKPHFLHAAFLDLIDQRFDGLFGAFVKSLTILGAVVEAFLAAEGIVPIVLEARVFGGLDP